MRTKFTIVVADDDLDDQELIRRGLKDCKVEVVIDAVHDGIVLMDYLLKRHSFRTKLGSPDVILVDLNMPLMDGFEALKEIRAYGFLRRIPVYVVTTSRSKTDQEKAIKLGAAGFYSKGASSNDIKMIMQEICRDCFEELSPET